MLTFNDDIQGTGAVNLAAVLAAPGRPAARRPTTAVVIFGAGTAGTGIADQLARPCRPTGCPRRRRGPDSGASTGRAC